MRVIQARAPCPCLAPCTSLVPDYMPTVYTFTHASQVPFPCPMSTTPQITPHVMAAHQGISADQALTCRRLTWADPDAIGGVCPCTFFTPRAWKTLTSASWGGTAAAAASSLAGSRRGGPERRGLRCPHGACVKRGARAERGASVACAGQERARLLSRDGRARHVHWRGRVVLGLAGGRSDTRRGSRNERN